MRATRRELLPAQFQPSGGHDAAHAVLRQGDGKLVLGGYATVGGATRVALVRYDTTGTLDPTFGTAGTVTTAINGRVDEAKGIAVQSDGKIVVVGRTAVPFVGSFGGHGFQDDMAILRYLP